ncbi:MAG: HAMP domain-containing sensor histidine kinase [Lachnospiraceae bacterium]|nr:HAMP domain-containing sensor histidine kinase [Lachnospiraceae bacterium]
MKQMLHSTPTLSHEINNYLTIVYSQLQHIEHLYKYLSKDDHWLRMKEDFSSIFPLLEQAMEEENFICATAESTPLPDFLEHLYQSWNPRLSEKHIRFQIPSEIEQVELPVSEYQLEHIFHNILTNSYDAICQKNKNSDYADSITIQTELEPKNLQVRIQDTGCGMNQHQLSHVLNPGITYKKNGHGIGLPLVLEIMESIDGKFQIFSSPGRGTIVLLKFPL